ncbi:MAG TPA: hypothetical protein VJI66_02450 [Candidatus Paceibacterota bacterium]
METPNAQTKVNTILAWVSIVLAVIAVIVAWATYNRISSNYLTEDGKSYSESISEMNIKIARLQASARLATLQAEQTVSQNYTALEDGVAEMRAELKDLYAEAKMETTTEWRELDAKFEALAVEIKAKSSLVAQSLRDLIRKLGE